MTDPNIESQAAIGELMSAAFQLAYFIHDDRASAMHIAISALRKLKVASTAQNRRAYYTPTGQSGYRAARTKVSLSELHMLQRLVYIESEVYERIEEERKKESLGQMDMIIRFIKHLVKNTIKRNSFYVSLGLSRVLYNYATAEAIEIYSSVVQDPERAREDYYYRSQKASLIRELKERFGDKLRIRKAKYGEERFEAQEDPEHYLELIRTCLLQFMPWQSKCVLPADFNPIMSVVAQLLFKGNHPDEEHSIEMNRIHTLIHPNCFRRLVLALGFDSPDQRLEVPYFFLSTDGPGTLGRRLNPPSLGEEEINVISDRITSEAARRRKDSGRLLSILVDGIERDRLDLYRTNSLRLEVGSGTELIEVRSRDSSEEILLAAHLMAHDESGIVPSISEVLLEGGQALSFEILSADKLSSEPSSALVTIRYRETRPMRAMSLLLRRLPFYFSAGFKTQKRSGVLTSKPAQVFLFLLIGIATALVYFQATDKPEQPIEAVEKEPAALDEGNASPPSAAKQEAETQNAESESAPPKAQQQEPSPGALTPPAERTRAPKLRSKSVMLLAVKRIYVSMSNDEPLSRQIREMITKGLESIGRFEIVARLEEADAMLDISATQGLSGGKVALALQIVNAEGQTLWPVGIKTAVDKYSGYPADVIDRALKDLLNDIQRMEKRR
ncbi:MAG TPA: hypothetical protein VF131_08405 [Blastocatellia bacterium]|nr:hypothetical protein [Blastocatellia bacterium]